MQKLAAVLLTILATNALAFQGRPVSDLRFEGRAGIAGHRVASDGTDFLLLTHRYEWFENATFIEKVVDGRTVGSHRYLGVGAPIALAWTGTRYLAAWGDRLDGMRIAALSRDGSVISMSETPVMQGEWLAMAANDSGALLFGLTEYKLTVQALDVTGTPVGIARTYDAPAYRAAMKAAPIAGGFGVVFSGNTTTVMLFRPDGSAMTAPVTIAYHSTAAAIATNGSDILVAFGARTSEGDAELKTAIVSPDGTLKSVRVIHTVPKSTGAPSIGAVGLVWDGTRYIAAVSVNKGPDSGRNADPALVPITRDGGLAGEITPITDREGQQVATGLGWNGQELLVPMYEPWPADTSFSVSIDPSTMQPSPAARFGRTLAAQSNLAVQAGHGGYLAAWWELSEGEVTIRASRIDAAGNYLDGEGVILDAIPVTPMSRFEVPERTIAIEGDGPQWFVAWSHGPGVRGRTLSPQGVAGAATIPIGPGTDVTVQWDGVRYVVLRSDQSMYSNTVSIDGVVGETQVLAEYEEFGNVTIEYSEPLLARLGGRMLGAYLKTHSTCYIGMPGNCDSETAVIGRLLDDPGASPFTIAEHVGGDLSLAASPTKAMIMWEQGHGLSGAFLPAAAPEAVGSTFRIDAPSSHFSLGFDGRDFVGAWWLNPYETPRTLVTARITAHGVVHDRRELFFNLRPFWVERPAVAAAGNVRSLVGFVGQLPVHDSIQRAGLLFVDEIGDGHAAPPAPSITCAAQRDDGSIRVSWVPIANIHGVAIDLQLPDGTFRNIGVAPSGATTATVSPAGLDGSAVRIRVWNGFGVSEPSAIAPSTVPLIDQQTVAVRVSRNQTATLSVVTATHGTGFAWYEGVRGDTTHPVGRNDATFTTPPATRTTQYWVRVTTACRTIDSETMTVSVDTRRRAARK